MSLGIIKTKSISVKLREVVFGFLRGSALQTVIDQEILIVSVI